MHGPEVLAEAWRRDERQLVAGGATVMEAGSSITHKAADIVHHSADALRGVEHSTHATKVGHLEWSVQLALAHRTVRCDCTYTYA